MPVSITKSTLSVDTINAMVEKAFGCKADSMEELTEGFFDGYGIAKLTPEQEKRAKWYDIYLFLIASLECDYRQYDTMDGYHWACEMLENWVKTL